MSENRLKEILDELGLSYDDYVSAIEEEEKINREELKKLVLGDVFEEDYVKVFVKEESLGSSIIKDYLKLFSKGSLRNDIYAHLTLHLILGQMFKDVKLKFGETEKDLRTNIFFISSSGSGKSAPISFISKIHEMLSMKFKVITGEVSEAALVGTFRQLRNRIVVVPGLLKEMEDGGTIFVDEGSMILKLQERQYNSILLNYVQAAMNPIGDPTNLIEKRLASGVLSIRPEVSFAFITYPIKDKIVEVLRTGLFQRMVSYSKILTPESWLDLSDEVIRSIVLDLVKDEKKWSELMKTEDFNYSLNMLIKKLKEVKKHSESVKNMNIEKDCLPFLLTVGKEMNERVVQLSGEVQDIFNSFRIRSIIEMLKIASHRALLDKRSIIKLSDLHYSSMLVKASLFSMIESVENLEEVAQLQDVFTIRWERLKKDFQFLNKRLLRNNDGSFDTKSFIDLMCDYFSFSKPRAYNHLQQWNKMKLIKYEKGTNVSSGKVFV